MCSECENLNLNDNYKGCISGCRYYCKKKNIYVDATGRYCGNFKKIKRDSDTIEKIINDSKEFYNDTTSIETYNFLIPILIIIFIIIVCYNFY